MNTPRWTGSTLLFGLLLFLNCGSARAAGNATPVKVHITCDGEDIPGQRVCSAVKEKIRASAGFELVQSPAAGVFCAHIVSIDLGNEGLSSAMSVTFTLATAAGTELFLTGTS